MPPAADSKDRRKPTILIVDDDPLLLEHISFALTEEGFETGTVEDGETALYKIGMLKPDVLVLDLTMPRMGGLEVLTHVKGNKATADTPVIILTASADIDNVQNALKLGAQDYVTKPVDMKKLIARIERVMERVKKERGDTLGAAQASGFDVPLERRTRVILGPGDEPTK